MVDLPEKAVVNWWRRFIVGWVVFLFGFILVWTIFASYSIQNVQHTWLMPANNPDGLRSDRYSFHMAALVSVTTVSWLLPILMLILVAYPSGNGPRVLFAVVTSLKSAYFVAIIIYWGLLYAKSNLSAGTNAGNPFNDERWCLLHRTNAPAYCSNLNLPTGASNELSSIAVGDLAINQWMMATFWMLFVYFFLIIISEVVVWVIFRNRVLAWEEAYTGKRDPLSEKTTDNIVVDEEQGGDSGFYTPYGEFSKNQLSMPTRFQKGTRKMRK